MNHPEIALLLEEFPVQNHLGRKTPHLHEVNRDCGQAVKHDLTHRRLIVRDDSEVPPRLEFLRLGGSGQLDELHVELTVQNQIDLLRLHYLRCDLGVELVWYLVLFAETGHGLGDHGVVQTGKLDDNIQLRNLLQFLDTHRETIVSIVLKILIDSPIVTRELRQIVVHDYELAVGDPPQRLQDTFPGLGIQREMRGDDIVVELAQILIDIIFKKIDLLVVQVDRDVRLAADRVVERVVSICLVLLNLSKRRSTRICRLLV